MVDIYGFKDLHLQFTVNVRNVKNIKEFNNFTIKGPDLPEWWSLVWFFPLQCRSQLQYRPGNDIIIQETIRRPHR